MGYGSIREVGRYRYEISAPEPSAEPSPTDSPSTTSGEFVVGRASSPNAKLKIVGRILTVTVAGVGARETVYPSLFGPGPSEIPDKEYPFFVDLPAKATDADGELIARFTLPSGIPRGSYLLWLEPISVGECWGESCLQFVVSAG